MIISTAAPGSNSVAAIAIRPSGSTRVVTRHARCIVTPRCHWSRRSARCCALSLVSYPCSGAAHPAHGGSDPSGHTFHSETYIPANGEGYVSL